jgi:hypothetical protein
MATRSRASVTADMTRPPSLLYSLGRQTVNKSRIVAASSGTQDLWILLDAELRRPSSLHWLLTSLRATSLPKSGDNIICIALSTRTIASTLTTFNQVTELLTTLVNGCRHLHQTQNSRLWILVPILTVLVSTMGSRSSEQSRVSLVGKFNDPQHLGRRHHVVQSRPRLRQFCKHESYLDGNA